MPASSKPSVFLGREHSPVRGEDREFGVMIFMGETPAEILARYASFYETLSPESLHHLGDFVTEDVQFIDPFHETFGSDRLREIFEKMFKDLENPRFFITSIAVDGNVGFLRWEFLCRHPLKKNVPEFKIVGVSEVHLNDDGKVTAHLDHWDAATYVYGEIPVLGSFFRWLKRRFT